MIPILRRILGATLLALSLLPVHRLLGGAETGLAGATLRERAEGTYQLLLWGGILVLALGTLISLVLPARQVREGVRTVAGALSAVPARWFAVGVGALAAALAGVLSAVVFRGLPGLGDEMVSLVHAGYWAGGQLLGPVPDPAAGWMIPNSLLLPEGWVSQYPPLHILLLAAGSAAGAVWLTGPMLTGLLVGASAGAADLLLPDRRTTARAGILLLALSPSVLLLGSGYTSHVPAAAFLACCLYLSLMARDGGPGWAVWAGAAMGAAVATRPWTGLVLGTAFTFVLWGSLARRRGAPWYLRRTGAAVLGGLPFAAGLLLYNAYVFGDPLELGYTAAWGPSHGLGFGADPWGNAYGPAEALGASAAELLSLGHRLLEMPLSAVALVGAYLLVARKLTPGAGVLVLWALLPVVANAFYWHHGLYLGPRMLYEAAPAWVLLLALSVRELAGGRLDGKGPPTALGPEPGARRRREPDVEAGGRYDRAREALAWSLVLALLASPALLLPDRLALLSWDRETLDRIRPPEVPGDAPALVFVHTSWSERVGSTLQAEGMRLDSVETALRRNGLCRVHRYAEALRAGGPLPDLRFEPLPGTPPALREVRVTPGYTVLLEPTDPPTPECRLELHADRRGVVSLLPLLWQGDVPGAEQGRPLFVRDLGPSRNRRIRERYPDREPHLFVPAEPGGPPRLLPYRDGVRRLWGGAGESSTDDPPDVP